MTLQGIMDQRREVRYGIDAPVQLLTEQKQRVTATAVNLSQSGLQVTIAGADLSVLMPRFKRPNPLEPLQLEVELFMPLGTDISLPALPSSIFFRAQIMYSRRLTLEVFQIGLQFCQLSKAAEQALVTLLRHCADAQTSGF